MQLTDGRRRDDAASAGRRRIAKAARDNPRHDLEQQACES
jgi:hypothetical protein